MRDSRASELPGPAWGRRRSLTATVVVSVILAFLLLPIVLVVPMSVGPDRFLQFPPSGFSLKWYAEYFRDPDWLAATWFSLKVAALTTLVSVVIGTMAAVALVRGLLAGRKLLTAIILAPIIVPHVILGVALYLSFAPMGLSGNLSGFVLAHSALAVPFVVLTVSAALYRVDGSLELAAMNLGASRLTAFRLITLPLITPGVAAGAVFAFLASFDEAVVAFFLSGVSNKTLPRKLLENIDYDISPVIPAVSTLLTLVSLTLMTCAYLLTRRRGSAS